MAKPIHSMIRISMRHARSISIGGPSACGWQTATISKGSLWSI